MLLGHAVFVHHQCILVVHYFHSLYVSIASMFCVGLSLSTDVIALPPVIFPSGCLHLLTIRILQESRIPVFPLAHSEFLLQVSSLYLFPVLVPEIEDLARTLLAIRGNISSIFRGQLCLE
jgi:hypothetical protein